MDIQKVSSSSFLSSFIIVTRLQYFNMPPHICHGVTMLTPTNRECFAYHSYVSPTSASKKYIHWHLHHVQPHTPQLYSPDKNQRILHTRLFPAYHLQMDHYHSTPAHSQQGHFEAPALVKYLARTVRGHQTAWIAVLRLEPCHRRCIAHVHLDICMRRPAGRRHVLSLQWLG